jgi:hypothetical protein
MTPASSATLPIETITVEAKLLVDDASGITVIQSPPSPEQVRAAEAVFSQQQDRDSHAVLGMLGIWTSTVLLHDLALEHFWSSQSDEEEEERIRKGKGLLPDRAGD